MSYKRQRKPSMTLNEFEEANTEYLQEERMDNNPWLAYMINEWELKKYYNDLNWNELKDIMVKLYLDYLW